MNLYHVNIPKRATRESAVGLVWRTGELFERMVRSLPVSRFVDQLSRAARPTYDRYFRGFRPQKVPKDRLIKVVRKEVMEREEEMIAHLCIVTWNEAHQALYDACRDWLREHVDPDVEKIELLTPEQSGTLLGVLVGGWGVEDVTILVALNDVRVEAATAKAMLPGLALDGAPANGAAGAAQDAPAEASAATTEQSAQSEDTPKKKRASKKEASGKTATGGESG
jgi:hypothetical protein